MLQRVQLGGACVGEHVYRKVLDRPLGHCGLDFEGKSDYLVMEHVMQRMALGCKAVLKMHLFMLSRNRLPRNTVLELRHGSVLA